MQREGRFMGVGRDRYSDRHPGGDATHLVTGGSMRNRYGTGMATKVAMAGAALAAAVVSVGGLAGRPGAAAATTAPGVTSNSITVGTISTQTGPISSNFSPLIYGEEGYFKYINAQG